MAAARHTSVEEYELMIRLSPGIVCKSCFLLLLVALAAKSGFAQLETATVSGQIVDPSGLSVTVVQVKLIDIDRDTTISAGTNASGLYTFPSVRPGRYRMEVRVAGFKVVNVTGITVNVQDHLEQNFKLAVGSVSESVTVEDGAPLVDIESSAVSTVVDRNFAENLPLNGRSFQTLIQLTPGVVVTPSNEEDGGQFSINGQRAGSNYWTVDGVSANIGVGSNIGPGNGFSGALGSFSALGGTNSLVSVDAMQEFRIQTSTYAPEFGRTPGGQISIVTRSGTNLFHGTAFDYLRNDIFDASNWFNGYTNNPPLPKSRERQNDFGGTFSGPLVKDHTFFFFSYEGLRLRLPQTEITNVPDLNARQNTDPALQPYLNAFPFDPNQPDLGNGIAQFNASISNPATLDAYSLRIDHRVSEKLTLFGRYDYSPSQTVQRGANNEALSDLFSSRITTQTATVGATGTISTTVVNDLRFNYSRTNSAGNVSMDNFGNAVPLTSPPFPNPFTSRDAFFSYRILSWVFGDRFDVGHNAQNLLRQINLVDSLSVQRGSHGLKFGVDFRRLSPLAAPAPYFQGVYFDDVPSAETGNSLLGFTFSYRQTTLLFRNLGIFAQDTWRMSPRFTLTYGLRWDLDFAPSSLSGPSIPAVTGYNLANFSQLAVAPAGTAPFKTTYGNVAPRLGVAYQLSQSQSWQTVLRGGFGVFYDLVSSETGNLVGQGLPPFSVSNFNVPGPFPFAPSEIIPPQIPATGDISELYAFNPNLRLPYTLEWNVALEQSLGKEQTVTASYVGASGKRLLQTSEILAPPTNPNLDGFLVDNTARSRYDALQIQFQRRLAHGLQLLCSYTWSHSGDNGSAGSAYLSSNLGTPGNPNENWGPSDFDIRTSLSAGLTYDIPTPRTNAFSNTILGGWSVQSIIQARSAPPVDISDTNFQEVNNLEADVRPDSVSGQPYYLYGSQYPGRRAFNPAAFMDPPVDPTTGNPLRQGNVPRNFLRGFGATQWDFAVHRDFPLHESLKLQFRAEMFNLLNHPNFGPPNGEWPGLGFGLSSQMLAQSLSGGNVGGGGFLPLYQMGGPRSLQLALKVSF
jgi:outer membrane receptor protein involved in Fe transport